MDSSYFEQEHETGFSSWQAFKSLLPLLKPHRWRIFANFLMLAFAMVISIAGPKLIQRAIDINIIQDRDFNGLLLTVIVYLLLQVIYLLATIRQRVHLETIGQDVISLLKQKCFDHVVRLSIAFFDKNPVGRLISRIESDGESLRQLFSSIMVMIIGDVILVVGMLTVMFYTNARLTLMILILAPIILAMLFFYQRFIGPKFIGVRRRMADVTASLTEFLQGMSIIQIFNRQSAIKKRMDESNRRKFKLEALIHVTNTAFFNVVVFIEKIGIAMVLYFGSKMVLDHVVTPGVLVMFTLYIRRFFEPIHRASEQMYVIQRAIAGARRIFALLSNDQIIPEQSQPRTWHSFENAIVFENVSFSYNQDDNFAIKDASFEIRKGEKVALVGMTGGGKSTIINLLLRFYDRTSGTITVDGIDVREISKNDLRAKFGLVLQDIFIFPGTVKDNITLEQTGVTEETLRQAAKLASAERFIERMPEKYDTELSERGANLSRGERQLLSFARAMIFNPQVLLLDEATSSVDPHTEKRIQVALKRLLTGRTSLIIAHRLSTILDADKILVIRDGMIIERGNHQELLAQGGYYEKLFRLQFQRPESVKVK